MIMFMDSSDKLFFFYINSNSETTQSVEEVNVLGNIWVTNPQASCSDVHVLTILPP